MHSHDLPRLLHADSPWWPRALIALGAALLIWLGARLLVLLLGGPGLPEPTLAADPDLARRGVAGPELPLSQWRLFGHAGTLSSLAQRTQQAPETGLQLQLRGTLNLDSSDGGIAIIADGSGEEAAYRVGDALPGGATLSAIYAGRVLLSRDGVDEGLSLLPPSAGSSAGSSAGGSGATARMPSGMRAAGTGSAAGLPGSAGNPFVHPGISTGVPSLESLRAATGTDVAELARQVNVQPVMENGRFAGVRLTVGRDSDILDRTGLRSTDLITAVNGIPLDGPQRQPELLRMLQGSRQINLTIRRDGQVRTLTVGL
jgi:general secretion pathway protein C